MRLFFPFGWSSPGFFLSLRFFVWFNFFDWFSMITHRIFFVVVVAFGEFDFIFYKSLNVTAMQQQLQQQQRKHSCLFGSYIIINFIYYPRFFTIHPWFFFWPHLHIAHIHTHTRMDSLLFDIQTFFFNLKFKKFFKIFTHAWLH